MSRGVSHFLLFNNCFDVQYRATQTLGMLQEPLQRQWKCMSEALFLDISGSNHTQEHSLLDLVSSVSMPWPHHKQAVHSIPAASVWYTFCSKKLFTRSRNLVNVGTPRQMILLHQSSAKDTTFQALRPQRQSWAKHGGIPGACSRVDENAFSPVTPPLSMLHLSFYFSQLHITFIKIMCLKFHKILRAHTCLGQLLIIL